MERIWQDSRCIFSARFGSLSLLFQTIIECLKYATTGELPPNSKTGGAFIHDPKLAGEKEVPAQVKVSFRSTSGARMVGTRNMVLTLKKATRSQKTLEGGLVIYKDGQRESVSTRVAELDQIIPQYLGVSKAVLESVIFCHQDESLWPMSEPSVLKKKFDEIFEAQKYTRAIENIKVLRKKQNEELGKYKIVEQHAKEDKEKGDRAEKKSGDLYDAIEVMRAREEQLNAEVEEAKRMTTEAFNHAAQYEQVVSKLQGKRIEMEANQGSVTQLEDDLQHMAETDEELQSMLDQYEERIALHNENGLGLRQQYADLKEELEDNRGALGQKQSEIGKYQAQKEQHDRQLQKRETLVKEAAKRHGIRGFDYDISDKAVSEFLAAVTKMSAAQEKTLVRARKEHQEELQKAQAGVTELTERRSVLNQRKDMAKSQIGTNDRRIHDLHKTMDQIEIDEGGEATLKAKKRETTEKLESAKSEADAERFDERIREADSSVRQLDEQKEKLDEELVEATKLASDSAQLEIFKNDLEENTQGFETMKKVHGARIAKIVDSDWDPATLEDAYQRVLKAKAADVKEAEGRREIAQSKLNNINMRVSNVESELKKKRTELQNYEKTVLAITDNDMEEFEEVLRDLEAQYEAATTEQGMIKAQLEYMESCLKTAHDDNVCRMCRRSLRDDKSEHFTRAGFFSTLEAIVMRAKSNLDAAENVDDLTKEVEAARNAKPSYDLALRLRDTELPALRSESQRLSAERDTLNKQLEEHDAHIYDLEASKQEVESISKDVQNILGYFSRGRELEAKIRSMTAKQKSAGSSRGIKAVQGELKSINDQLRSARTRLNSLTAGRDKLRNQINMLELRSRDIDAELNNAQTKLKEKRALAERIEEFRSQNSEERESIRKLDRDIQDLVPRIEQAQLTYDDVNRRGTEKVQRLQEEASKLTDTVRQLSEIGHDIDAYIDQGGPQQLVKAQKDFNKLEEEVQRIEEDQVDVTRQIKKIEDTVRNTEDTKRKISDNLRYRVAKLKLDRLQVEIEHLESQNAEHDKARYESEAKNWQWKWNKSSTEHNKLIGEISGKDEQLKELVEEWETDYKDAAVKYREAHIRVETTKAAVEDLGRYGGALDKAIMKYHTLKMEEINRIVEELWKNAYQGTDVDTIRIRSDNETARGNRSYNYRVVMVKQETEMDMRGRCSAGQKVLASIVIRLALAECFGVNCGLIALDEPTTNLDQQNIKGLAESLSEIIKARRKQANFQLIVITHDEQFLREMNCADYTDVYWRVSRREDQTSEIKMQMISEVSL
jgi:DNA repair protein RAD50